MNTSELDTTPRNCDVGTAKKQKEIELCLDI